MTLITHKILRCYSYLLVFFLGQPWRYWKMVKNLRNDKLTEPDLLEHKKDYFAPSSSLTMDNVEGLVNSLVTSTPQKHGQ